MVSSRPDDDTAIPRSVESDRGLQTCLNVLPELQLLRREQERDRRDSKVRLLDEGAVEAFERGACLAPALGLDREDLRGMELRGLAFVLAGHVHKGRAVFEALRDLGERSAHATLVLASCCDLLGDRTSAAVFFNEGLRAAERGGQRDLVELALGWGRHLVARGEER